MNTQRSRILNPKQIHQLFDHIFDGFKSSHQGAEFIRKDGIIDDKEYHEILRKNAERLIQRVEEFRITNRLLSIFFAFLFGYMQINGDDMERTSRSRTRTRTSRSARGRSGRRRNELDSIMYLMEE